MRILITTTQIPFIHGGAEFLAADLRNALIAAGHEAEIVTVPFKWYPAMRIPEHITACRLLDISNFNGVPIDLVIGLKFPAYLMPHPNKVLWILHQYRAAYDMWGSPLEELDRQPEGAAVRHAITSVDNEIIPQAKQVYTISKNVSARLKKYNGIDSQPLYPPPPGRDSFYCCEAENYLLYPSRIGLAKRQHLVIEALARTKQKVFIKFSGRPDNPEIFAELKQLAQNLGVADRIKWLGVVSEEEKWRQYARSLAVVYTPVDEDMGYVTSEAMLSSKPVLSCSDAGGALDFILPRETGLIAEPTPESLAEAMDEIWLSRSAAKKWGENGRALYDSMNITWPNIVNTFLAR